MSKSKFVIDKLAKLFEQGLVSYKDLSEEILNILRSKRDEIVFKMKLTSKEETEILNLRIEKLEKKIEKLEKKSIKSRSKKTNEFILFFLLNIMVATITPIKPP
jgi:hypothetical protein